MTVREKRAAIREHCIRHDKACSVCKLANAKVCHSSHATDEEIEQNYNILFGPEAADERGANNMEKQIITIDLERYEELVRKEAIYDKLTESNDVYVYLAARLEEVKTNA